MKRFYIGIDTSNYTTSCALYEACEGKFYSNVKCLLEVKPGERGLRQSDAVFAHVKNLPVVTGEALCDMDSENLLAIGVSVSPRDAEGSYMPCFLAGEAAASTLANAVKKPLHRFSHQSGHIIAAIYSSGSRDLLINPHIAFHVSGGTTELLMVTPDNTGFRIEKLGGTLDISAGQAVDRVGVMMGLSFPCGPELEMLAARNTEPLPKPKLSVKGCECNLSGLENMAKKLIAEGRCAEYTAAFVLDFIGRTLVELTKNALGDRSLPVVYAGGVMSNARIKSELKKHGFDARFASPEFSSDNAAGTALLCAAAEEGWGFWHNK